MKFILRIDDVGRQPGDTPEQGTDSSLDYFLRWRKALGLAGLPCYYGVVPTWINLLGREVLLDRLEGKERTAIHGWDHVHNSTIDVARMNLAMREIRGGHRSGHRTNLTKAYIPPYNWYSATTMKDWKEAGGEYFFGGFDEHYPGVGPFPSIQHDLLYLPAYRPLYGHAHEVLAGLSKLPEVSYRYPLVITLHVPWDPENDWPILAIVVNKIKDSLITLEEAEKGLPYGG